MEFGGAGRRWRGRGTFTTRRLVAASLAVAAVAGVGTWTAVAADGGAAVHREDHVLQMPETPGSAQTVGLDTSYFTTGTSPRPAVLLAHGFGGSKEGERVRAEQLARSGYAVLTWSARGFGHSGGRIGLNAPDREVEDVKHLVDWLGTRPEVRLDGPGDPRVGITGASYGGAVALLGSAADPRIDAVGSQITWWNLADALFPQGVRQGPQAVAGGAAVDGVFKKLWAGIFFTTGSAGDLADAQGTKAGPAPAPAGPVGCGRFLDELCAMYDRVATTGHADPEAVALLDRSSPSSVAGRLKAPTLVVQGQQDSLFPLDQGDAIAKAVAANGAPVAVDWFAGGHDGGTESSERVDARVTGWFDHWLKGAGNDVGPAFRVTRTGGVDSTGFQAVLRGATADAYPGLAGTGSRSVELTGAEQAFANPPGGAPPNISTLPGIGALAQAASLGGGLSLDFPGQNATFDSAPLSTALHLTGQPTVPVRVSADRPEAVLFAKLYDLGPDGKQSLPQQLVAPLRVTGADAPGGRTVQVALPAVDHDFPAGHRLRLVLASTDLAYASPAEPATYRAAVAGPVVLPTVDALKTEAAPLPARTWALPLVAAGVAALLLLGRRGLRRRGQRQTPDPALAGVPLQISGLSKRYKGAADRYAVRDLGFRVEQGQVLGLLGPNGAGKTTTLRMLMGLIRPDEGEIRLFGHPVRPGAPVLSRVGSFVEGAGFLPHLTGRANLQLYWQATGRPAEDAHLEEALVIADLGEALDRAVRTYSQGMRQRLAIAQAMLGLPDLLILDEPTNGLDPPQIREMREVMIRYATAGRTVIVSSHLLSEVEQSCTHLVVMDRGRLVSAGAVADIVGAGEMLLIGTSGGYGPDELAVAADKAAALAGVGSAEVVEGGLLVRLDGMTADRLIAELVRLGVPVDRAGPHRRLEDAFLSLIGGSA
ncbi:ABC transporter ATP-binding protein [Kitasatospora herbaricolor]|uniref:alpha/beta fold hydrolase n=1 Tax=Kitasatospora herbaricolor TaxID=68217 RepID=UPI00174C8372|nr:alpha/beta fold hydrolase [Kitasatospora herbaricolor]MDQ0307802.1 ABC-2 type transport system ATP-binding protein [Kitasatospora herbaricolor]GGV26049.1 ABC transporter ATP-binding protein [Kitasatospora herbaricolor]